MTDYRRVEFINEVCAKLRDVLKETGIEFTVVANHVSDITTWRDDQYYNDFIRVTIESTKVDDLFDFVSKLYVDGVYEVEEDTYDLDKIDVFCDYSYRQLGNRQDGYEPGYELED